MLTIVHKTCCSQHRRIRLRVCAKRHHNHPLYHTRRQCSHDGLTEPERSENAELQAFETSRGVVAPLTRHQAKVDYLGESTVGNLAFTDQPSRPLVRNPVRVDLADIDKVLATPFKELKAATQDIIKEVSISTSSYPGGDPRRAIFCSRTLNLRSIQAVGFDMDYTLIVYDEIAWEGKAYQYCLRWLKEQGLPVEGLQFDPTMVIRGLILDRELGNLVKVDRFGYVKRAMHGTRMMTWAEIHSTYGRELVNLKNEARYMFLNTLFSVSEAVLFCQLVDRLDDGEIGAEIVGHSYPALYKLVSKALFRAHVEGKLKAEIVQEPEKYVELDPEMAQTLLDQKQAGKQLLLITNSDYQYTQKLMSFAYDRFLPSGMTWRDLFDLVIVNARKPDFFNHNMSLYEIVTEDGLMRPAHVISPGGVYCGGSAKQVEAALGVSGDAILYVGDHIYTDNALAKLNFRWRTALIVRELEHEIEALAKGRPHRQQLKEAMNKKEMIGDVFNQLRLARQRVCFQPLEDGIACELEHGEALSETLAQLLAVLEALDRMIGPMLEMDGHHFNERWGYLSRAGFNDKSQLTRQIEKYADIYTSRVSNFLRYTPFVYFRSPSQSLAHDRELTEYYTRKYGAVDMAQDAQTDKQVVPTGLHSTVQHTDDPQHNHHDGLPGQGMQPLHDLSMPPVPTEEAAVVAPVAAMHSVASHDALTGILNSPAAPHTSFE